MTNTHEQSYAVNLFAKAEQQAAVDWELVETSIWGRKYPHKEHKDIALADITFAYSLGSAFRICLTGDRKALPRLLRLQLITEIATVRARLGQHRYKVSQAEMWGNACAVTGITEPALLRASHAKPWADANDAERLDPANGLPLAVHLDALFDAGLISFDSHGKMMLSPKLSQEVIALWGLSDEVCLRKPHSDRQEKYLRYHRENVFQATYGRGSLR